MRSLLTKLTAVAVAAFMMLSFVAAPAASAQTYPPTLPGPSGLPSAEIVAVIQANNLVVSAANANSAASAQAFADDAAALVAQAKAAGFSAGTIATLQAAANAAAASAAAFGVPAAAPVSNPVAAPINLAFTGADVNVPLAAGAIMVGAGGLVLLAARKREQNA